MMHQFYNVIIYENIITRQLKGHFPAEWVLIVFNLLHYYICIFTSSTSSSRPPRIIVDLLKMNVAPQAVFQTLKAMCAGQRVAESCGAAESATVSHTTSITTAPTEARGQCLQRRQWDLNHRYTHTAEVQQAIIYLYNNINIGYVVFRCPLTEWQWANTHSIRTLNQKQLNYLSELWSFLLWLVRISAVKKVYQVKPMKAPSGVWSPQAQRHPVPLYCEKRHTNLSRWRNRTAGERKIICFCFLGELCLLLHKVK